MSQFLLIVLALTAVLLLRPGASGAAHGQPASAVPMIYWTDRAAGTVNRANIDGSGIETLLQIDPFDKPRGLTLDMRSETLYFISDEGGGTRRISRMDLDGSNLQEVLSDYLQVRYPNQLAVDALQNQLVWSDSGEDVIGRSNLDGSDMVFQFVPGPKNGSGMALDPSGRKIYWTEYGSIYRSNLDGSDTQGLPFYFPGPGYSVTPVALALDETAGKLYHSTATRDMGRGYAIVRTNLDGSGAETLIPDSDGRSAGIALDAAAGKMYWTVGHTAPQIKRANLDGSGEETVVGSLSGPFDLDLDLVNNKIYWTDWVQKRIMRAGIDGSTVEVVLSTAPQHPRYLTLDVPGGKLFWTGDGGEAVWQANLDGSDAQPLIGGAPVNTRGIVLDQASGKLIWSNATTQAISKADKAGGEVEDIIIRRLYDPQGIAVNEITGMMYWVDFESDMILRASPNGSNYQELVTEGLDLPTSLALDPWQRKMYWTDVGKQEIGRANLDGSATEVLLSSADGLEKPAHIALDLPAGKMYWSDHGTGTISRANLDGSGLEVVISSGLQVPSSLALSTTPVDVQRSYVPMIQFPD